MNWMRKLVGTWPKSPWSCRGRSPASSWRPTFPPSSWTWSTRPPTTSPGTPSTTWSTPSTSPAWWSSPPSTSQGSHQKIMNGNFHFHWAWGRVKTIHSIIKSNSLSRNAEKIFKKLSVWNGNFHSIFIFTTLTASLSICQSAHHLGHQARGCVADIQPCLPLHHHPGQCHPPGEAS